MPVRTALCFGDSNTHGSSPKLGPASADRYGPADRWPGVMRSALGPDWLVVEEGLPGRTTVHDDAVEGIHKNGHRYLQACLESHKPIDLLVIMLGTNDLKARFSLPASDIAAGVGVLCQTALRCEAGPAGGAPKLLVVSPVPVIETGLLAEMFTGGAAKSQRLADLYRVIAERFDAGFFDAGSVATCSPVDGIHFEPDQHRLLGAAMARVVQGLF